MNKFLALVCCLASLVSARPDVSLGYHYHPGYNSGADLLSAPLATTSYSPAASGSSGAVNLGGFDSGAGSSGINFLSPGYSVGGLSSGFSSGSGLSSSGFSGGSGLSSSGFSGGSGLSSSGFSGGSGLSSGFSSGSGSSGFSSGSGLSSGGGLGYASGSGLSSGGGLGYASGSGLSSGGGLGFASGSGLSGSGGLGYSGGLGLSGSGSGYNSIGLGSVSPVLVGVNQGYSGGVNSLGATGFGQFSQQQYAAQFPQQAPIITKNFYVHSAPEDHDDQQIVRYVTIGRPLKNYKVLFINAPSSTSTRAKIIANVAPVEDRTAIYVLSKKTNDLDISADVVTPAPTGPTKPDVFFIKYKTPEEAIHAQHVIQAQYDQLGGSTNFSNEGFVPVQSVIGSLGQTGVITNANVQGIQGIQGVQGVQGYQGYQGVQGGAQFISQGSENTGLLPDQSQIDQVSGGRIQSQQKYLPPTKYKKY